MAVQILIFALITSLPAGQKTGLMIAFQNIPMPILIIAIIVIFVLAAAYFGISAYIARRIMRIPRLPLGADPSSVGLAYENVSFPSRIDRLISKGWYIPGKKILTVIIVTGMHQNRVDYEVGVLNIARDLAAEGYPVLLFDQRGRGQSEGSGILLTRAGRDIGGAVDYVKTRGCPPEKIVLMGFSAGAACSVIFAGREGIGGIISDSCFPHVSETFIGKGVSESHAPRWLIGFFVFGALVMARIMYGYRKVNPIDCVPGIACPILFIQGGRDDLITPDDARRLAGAARQPCFELWIVPQAAHTMSYAADSAGYMERVIALLKRVEKRERR
jgi:alpha-beta hydrolase superfamily lysophospholipase